MLTSVRELASGLPSELRDGDFHTQPYSLLVLIANPFQTHLIGDFFGGHDVSVLLTLRLLSRTPFRDSRLGSKPSLRVSLRTLMHCA